MRIARALSALGYCSRREAERLVTAGRVVVNGARLTSPASFVDPTRDRVVVDGRPLAAAPRRRYIAVHKPRGVVSTVHDAHAERTVVQLVPGAERLYPVGRLDKDSEGLILLTNHGEFAHAVAHPRFGIEREYRALVAEQPATATLGRLRRGVPLDGRLTRPAQVAVEAARPEGVWLRLVLREGRHHEVRRLLEAIGHPVRRLQRVRIGPVHLGALRPGQHRDLRADEVSALMAPLRPTDGAPRASRSPRLVVAIDGPAGVGKTTVGSRLAQRLGAVFLDTGVLYRALTLLAIERQVPAADARRLAELAAELDVRVRPPTVDDGRPHDVLLGGRDVTSAIRAAEVDRRVSEVASHAAVRAALVPAQRAAAGGARAVVVGRDIGTVIFPDADVKIYLDASVQERARRRAAQNGVEDQEAIEASLVQRDRLDAGREVAPLARAADAIVVETENLPVEKVVDRILAIVQHRRGVGEET